jgi:hypothetical protein
MGTTYVPFLIDLFLYFYELAIMQGLQKSGPYHPLPSVAFCRSMNGVDIAISVVSFISG